MWFYQKKIIQNHPKQKKKKKEKKKNKFNNRRSINFRYKYSTHNTDFAGKFNNQRDKDLAGEWSGQARLDSDDRDPIDKRHFVVNLTSSTPKKWKRKDFIVWYKGKHAHFAEKYEISIANGVEPSGYKYTPNVSAEWKGHATEYRHKNWKKGDGKTSGVKFKTPVGDRPSIQLKY